MRAQDFEPGDRVVQVQRKGDIVVRRAAGEVKKVAARGVRVLFDGATNGPAWVKANTLELVQTADEAKTARRELRQQPFREALAALPPPVTSPVQPPPPWLAPPPESAPTPTPPAPPAPRERRRPRAPHLRLKQAFFAVEETGAIVYPVASTRDDAFDLYAAVAVPAEVGVGLEFRCVARRAAKTLLWEKAELRRSVDSSNVPRIVCFVTSVADYATMFEPTLRSLLEAQYLALVAEREAAAERARATVQKARVDAASKALAKADQDTFDKIIALLEGQT